MEYIAKAFGTSRRRLITESDSAVAVEFALISPVLLMMIFGIFSGGILMATLNGLEQIAAGAARSTLQGQTDPERTSLATSYIASNVATYPYLDKTRVQIATLGDTTKKTFTVTVVYDMSGSGVYQVVRSLMPNLPTSLSRQSVVLEGGY